MKHFRTDKQAEHEEDDDLHQSRDPVEKTHQGLLVGELPVAEDYSDNVGAQVAVAPDKIRHGIGCDSHGEYEKRIKARSLDAESVQGNASQPGYAETAQCPESYLGGCHPDQSPS